MLSVTPSKGKDYRVFVSVPEFYGEVKVFTRCLWTFIGESLVRVLRCLISSLCSSEEQTRPDWICLFYVPTCACFLSSFYLLWDRPLFIAWGDGRTEGFSLCHDRIYLIPLQRLCRVLMNSLIDRQFSMVPSLRKDWYPLCVPHKILPLSPSYLN